MHNYNRRSSIFSNPSGMNQFRNKRVVIWKTAKQKNKWKSCSVVETKQSETKTKQKSFSVFLIENQNQNQNRIQLNWMESNRIESNLLEPSNHTTTDSISDIDSLSSDARCDLILIKPYYLLFGKVERERNGEGGKRLTFD